MAPIKISIYLFLLSLLTAENPLITSINTAPNIITKTTFPIILNFYLAFHKRYGLSGFVDLDV